MLVGPIGVGLALAARRRELPAVAFVGAALLPDVAFRVLVLLGVGRAHRRQRRAHAPARTHGLVPTILWAAIAGAAAAAAPRKSRREGGALTGGERDLGFARS